MIRLMDLGLTEPLFLEYLYIHGVMFSVPCTDKSLWYTADSRVSYVIAVLVHLLNPFPII